MSMTIAPISSSFLSLSFHTTAPLVSTNHEARLLQSMQVLIALPATVEHAALRHRAVCHLLEVMQVVLVDRRASSKALWTEGLQRLARLWLARPPVITWHSSSLTCKQVWSWLRTSLERSVQALCRKQRRERQRYHSLEAIQEECGDRIMQGQGTGLDAQALREALCGLVSRARELVLELTERYASRSDVRRAIPQHTDRLMALLFYPEVEDWIRAHHPEKMGDDQEFRRFRDRLHTQHKRARTFLRSALEFYLEEEEVEQELLTFLLHL